MELRIDNTGPYPVARLWGEIRSEDAPTFVEEIHPLVAQSDSKLAIDLSGVSFLDSTGLASLINVVTRARLASGRTILVSPTPFVAGVFEVTNLDQWFEIAGNLDEAAKCFSAGDQIGPTGTA